MTLTSAWMNRKIRRYQRGLHDVVQDIIKYKIQIYYILILILCSIAHKMTINSRRSLRDMWSPDGDGAKEGLPTWEIDAPSGGARRWRRHDKVYFSLADVANSSTTKCVFSISAPTFISSVTLSQYIYKIIITPHLPAAVASTKENHYYKLKCLCNKS